MIRGEKEEEQTHPKAGMQSTPLLPGLLDFARSWDSLGCDLQAMSFSLHSFGSMCPSGLQAVMVQVH